MPKTAALRVRYVRPIRGRSGDGCEMLSIVVCAEFRRSAGHPAYHGEIPFPLGCVLCFMMCRFVFLLTMGVSFAQPRIAPDGVRNSASYTPAGFVNTGIAQG